MCKKQIEWWEHGRKFGSRSWRIVEAVAVAGWWAFAPAASCSLSLSAHLFRTFSLLTLALEINSPTADHFTSRHTRLRFAIFAPIRQLDGRLIRQG